MSYPFSLFRWEGKPLMKKILIVGAGVAGRIIAESVKANQVGDIIGFTDDDSQKIGQTIDGIPVIGNLPQTRWLVRSKEINQVIIAIPSAPGEVIKAVVDSLVDLKELEVLIAPGYFNLHNRDVEIDYPLREIEYSDLLGRKSVNIDLALIEQYIKNKTILITGAGGSIGGFLSKLVASLSPKKLILLGRGENSIFEIMHEIQDHYQTAPLFPVIANIIDIAALDRIFQQYKPQVVFHAAAHKHVGLMQNNAREAFINNVMGSANVMQMADQHNSERFILISTDKAVNPTSVMGASKRLAEYCMLNYSNKSSTLYCAVRFGNVLGSRGSVVPIFKKQIKKGGPVTVTHPEVTRYFMTIPEACQLVLQATTMANSGNIFVLDMGKPIKIMDLANQLIKLYAPPYMRHIPIKITGLLPGEKIYEELLTKEENIQKTIHEKIFIAPLKTIDFESFFKDIEKIKESLSKEEEIIKDMLFEVINKYA